MRFIREDDIQQAFVVLMNKLIFGHSVILKPLRQELRRRDQTGSLAMIKELEKKIEGYTERIQVLVGLMTKGHLDPALFISQKNELHREVSRLKEEKVALNRAIDGGITTVTQIEALMKYVAKAEGSVDSFDDKAFERFVDNIMVFSPTEIGFRMKCGITLRERLAR